MQSSGEFSVRPIEVKTLLKLSGLKCKADFEFLNIDEP